MVKKLFAIALVIGMSLWAVAPNVNAATLSEDQIDSILSLLESFGADTDTIDDVESALRGEPVDDDDDDTPSGECMCEFTRNLYPGMEGEDVKCLQEYLNDAGYTVASSGVGSPGNETMYFGSLTRAAVKEWQDAMGIEYGAYWGYFGPSSQSVYNSTCEMDDDDDDDDDDDVDVEGDVLDVSLSATTPDSASVADGANAKFTKLVFTAGDEDVEIDKIYVYRDGLSANTDLENVKIVDEDGVYYGNIGSFNTNNKAMITFTSPLEIDDGDSEVFYIQAGFVSAATAGRTASLGIESADDIECNVDVEGDFPVMGNEMSIVSIGIGTATFDETSALSDSTPDIGDENVILNKFKVTAGSTEGITIESITAMEAGSASLDDVENIELYSVTDGETLAEVDGWNASGKAHWSDLDVVIDKGETHRFEIRVDVVDGAGLTLNADIIDGSDVLAQVKGNDLGFYITPTVGTWTNSNDGRGANNQTINSGGLTVTKSGDTPATGNIAPADDQVLTVLDFYATGEDVRVSSLTVDCSTTTGFDSGEVTNVKIYDEDGDIVAGPGDLGDDGQVTFSDVFVVPVGTHGYTIKAKISSDCSTGDSIQCGIAASSDITAKGMTTNETISPSAASVYGNWQTVAAASLSATNLLTPIAQDVAQGADGFLFTEVSLDAVDSGEDVEVTAVEIDDTTGTVTVAGDMADINNIEIWADLDSSDSSRGDDYETKVSDAENPTDGDGTQAFTLTDNITIAKGTFVKIAVIGDVAADAATGTHKIIVSDVTANGVDTGKDCSDTSPSGTGQLMTITGNGTLTLSVDSSSPIADILLSEQEEVTVGIFKLAADAVENLDLDSFKITDDGTSGNDIVETFYFYHGDTLIGAKPGGATAKIQVLDGMVTVPKDDDIKITVKATMNRVDGSEVSNGDTLITTVAAAGDVETTGLSSGADVNNTDTSVDCATHTLYESRPYFSLADIASPGTPPNSNLLLMVVDVTAADTEDVTFVSDANASNSIVFHINGTTGSTSGTWTLKDGEGTTLDTQTVDLSASSSVRFAFDTNSFTVPAGETKQLKVYGDTSDFVTGGENIQLGLEATDGDIDWSIDGTGSYNKGDIIFKGGINGPNFVNPS
jgi:hypothetical protein